MRFVLSQHVGTHGAAPAAALRKQRNKRVYLEKIYCVSTGLVARQNLQKFLHTNTSVRFPLYTDPNVSYFVVYSKIHPDPETNVNINIGLDRAIKSSNEVMWRFRP